MTTTVDEILRHVVLHLKRGAVACTRALLCSAPIVIPQHVNLNLCQQGPAVDTAILFALRCEWSIEMRVYVCRMLCFKIVLD